MRSGIVVAIDGPAGAGKSTVAKAVAARLGLVRLDTGSMYRAVAWAATRSGLDLTDESAVATLARKMSLDVRPDGVYVDGVRREAEIRTPEVSASVSTISAHPAVRREMVARQQALISSGAGVVIEGRDIGTVVAPSADLKVFLTASLQERARRREDDLRLAGEPIPRDPESLIRQRDAKDNLTTPLIPALGAVVVDSSGKTLDQVVDEICHLASQRMGAGK